MHIAMWLWRWAVETNQYGFFGADTDISAVHVLIISISKIFKSCFLLHYQKYNVFYALPFFKNLKIRIYELKFFKLQQFKYFDMIFDKLHNIVYAVYNE